MKRTSFYRGLALLLTHELDAMLIYGAGVCGAAYFLSGAVRARGQIT